MANKLSILNDPPKILDGPCLLHELVHFNQHSHSCAIDFTSKGKRETYTYKEVRSCVSDLVLRIQEILDKTSTTTQHVIPILLPQSPSLYISQLAILESGGAFCPINLDAPKDRIRFVVGDVSARLLITTAEFREAVTWKDGPEVIIVDEFPFIPQLRINTELKQHAFQPLDLAYIMYTSGSSGTPKGVAVSHHAVSQSLLAHEKYIPIFSRFLQFAAPSFDVSVFEIFFPLSRGTTLIGCDRTQLLDDLPGMINELGVDAAELTPTVVGALLKKRANVPGLKLLLTIGEMLTRPIVEEFGGSETKKSMLYGMYGPTEAAIHCTIHPEMKTSAKPGNIGFPLDTVAVFIAAANPGNNTEDIHFLSPGDFGELVLGGPQLAEGYLNRADQNKAAFIHSKEIKYYRTGDKARLLENGTIEILGRMSDGQVKLRGQRVELGEIEDTVYKHPGISSAVATILGNSLVVFALLSDARIAAQDISRTCSKWLPQFMVPSDIIVLQKFPYLPSGKVDKRKLEADYQEERENLDSKSENTFTSTELMVKETLQQILGKFPAGKTLSSVGLDSLKSIQVAAALRSIGFEISTLAVLKAETLAELSAVCEKPRSNPTESSNQITGNIDFESMGMLNGNANNVESIMLCTPLQSAMLSETLVNERAYRNWVELEIVGLEDSDQILSALYDLSYLNPILRSGFIEPQNSKGFSQITWKSFLGTQIEEVDQFDYEYDETKDRSLRHPIRFQIQRSPSSMKLLVHLHHALYDGWSLELMLDDLDQLLKGGLPPSRPSFCKVVDSYSDGTLVADSWLSKDYWRDHLAYLNLSQVPNFHSKKQPTAGPAVTSLHTSLSTSQIETTAKRMCSSPQAILQAAYALVLSSYLGTADICFGNVFSGRTLPVIGIEDIAGPCIATLPIRVDISTGTTLQALVQDLNSINRNHLEHSAIPLRDIKLAGGVEPYQPLFDTLLIWQQTLHSYSHTRDHVSLVGSTDNLEFKLTLEVVPGNGNIEIRANYNTALFPKSQIELLLHQVEQIARLIVEKADTPLSEISTNLHDEVLSIENENPEMDFKSDTLVSPVERIAAVEPDRIAVCFASSINGEESNKEHVTYSELNSRANQMSNYLQSLNVLPDDLVCIFMEKCIDIYVSILAVAKSGAGYLPATPDTPLERLRHILQQSKVNLIVAQTASRLFLKPFENVKIVYIDEINFTIIPNRNPVPNFSPNNVSYCIYTSGSTGTPKGVLVTQGNLLSNLEVLEELYPTISNPRLLQSCSQAFDVSVFEIFYTWRIGGCLCSAEKDILFRDIENSIRLLGITHLSLTPTVAALVDPENVPNVKFLVTAGEAVTQKVFKSWAGHGLYQGYGPSETTNICTIRPRLTQDDFIDNIGRPFRNTSAFVLSQGPGFSLVLRGGEGEFCFGGSQVFRGYVSPTQENEKIIQHPKYGRLYKSGDFGRIMPDGSLAFTGRKDDQIKIRGQRVELGEINKVLLQSLEVQDAVTMVFRGDEDSQHLVSFWTTELCSTSAFACLKPDPVVVSKLYQLLQSSLPVYMVPSALILVSFLPATAQGKINKRLLEQNFRGLSTNDLETYSQTSRSSIKNEWSNLELQIADALAQTMNLRIEDIGIDTSFFNLGIDSISAIPIARLLRKTTGKKLEISDILKNPSISRLAASLSTQSEDAAMIPLATVFDFGFEKDFQESTTERFRQAGKSVESILPCTPLQEAMLSAAEASSERMYNNHMTLKIAGNAAMLQNNFIQMVERHEILRTCFITTEMPRYPFVQVVLKEHNVHFGSAGVIEKASSSSEFEPPWSISFIQAHGSTNMVISMHHALYDGVAISVLFQEVEDLSHGKELPHPVSFEPFLEYMASRKLEDSDKFWGETLANYSPSRLQPLPRIIPISSPGPKVKTQRRTASVSLSWVARNARKHNTPLLSVFHTVWASIISKLFQETDVCFGNVVSGRTLQLDGIERLVAPCFNTLPSRLQNVHKLSYLEAFRKFQALNVDAIPFQLTPLRRLQSRFSPDGSRLFDTLFILQQPFRDLDSSIWTIIEDEGLIEFPLVCEVLPRHSDDTLEIVIHSHSSFFDENDVRDILESFNTILRSALETPRCQLLSPIVKELITVKAMKQQKHVEKVDEQNPRVMSLAEINIRDIIMDFTDVPMEKINRDTSIFKLGLDSISTVQVAALLRKQGNRVSSSDILQHPTISQLNAYIESVKPSVDSEVINYDFVAFETQYRESVCSKLDIGSRVVEAIRPCTAVQQGMLAQSLHSNGENYVNSIWLQLSSGTSLSKLKSAWEAVVEIHEMLRTGFVQTDYARHPFVMITYTKESYSLPWRVAIEEDQRKSSIINNLTGSPWNISLDVEGDISVLRLTFHHALYDGQSMQMILSDVIKCYNNSQLPRRSSIASLLGPILIEADESEEQRTFWQTQENKLIVNRFPDITPLRVLSDQTLVREIFSNCSIPELEHHCRRNGVTMQAAGQAAWARLLTAYIGEVSTTFGITLSGRSIHEDAVAVSFPTIITLPFRCDVIGPNKELLGRTMKANASLQIHQFTPLTSIQKWAGYHEGKIFDTLFAYQKLPETKNEAQTPWKINQEESSVDYAISMEVQPLESGRILFRLTFKENIIPFNHAELLLKQYDALLLDTLENPQNPCDVAPNVGLELLSVTPAKDRTLPDSVTLLHQYVERGAQTWQDRTALEFATRLEPRNFVSQTWTYRQLDDQSNKVANLLLEYNVLPGEIIAICFDKCPEASFAIIGILKSGCSYVALDPTAPIDRLEFILEDSDARLILSSGKLVENFVSSSPTVIDLGLSSTYQKCSSMPPKVLRDILPQDVAYCLYTSGTTGTPKGCLITHENAVQAMLSFQRLFAGHWTSESKWLQFASFHFDVSVLELFWSWSVGICVASAPKDLIFEDIAGAIRELGITHIDLTPSLARLISPAEVPGLCKGVFITGGEQLRQDILDAWGEQGCIYNGYGPTEATIGCTMYPRVPKNGKTSNIGPQFDNVGSFVLKPGTEFPVFRGGIGELCVSGKLVGKGYLNRPELTAERFPTIQPSDERVYRTGDLVRILFDGTFIFLGRADDQVKLRGQRLELSEINEVIKKSTDKLEDVQTLVLKHATQQKEQLVTFLVSSSKLREQQIGEFISSIKMVCKARLPGYMVPTHFVPVDLIPLNANNKADSKQLAAIYNGLSIVDLQNLSHSKQNRSWSEDEKNIVAIIAQAIDLDISTLTQSSNIFELGLDSISIIGFSRSLQKAGLTNAKLSIVKKNPSIGALVQSILNQRTTEQTVDNYYVIASQNITAFSQKHIFEICKELEIESTEVECLSPCTPMQEGIIYQFLDSESPIYFNKFEFCLDKCVGQKDMLNAWNKVIQNLQILRTKFVLTDDGFAQIVVKSLDAWSTRPLDYSFLEKSSALKSPFKLNLSSGNNLTIQIFHGLYDGNSMTMLLRHVIDEYHAINNHNYGPKFHSSLAYGPLAKIAGAKEFWANHLQHWSYRPITTNTSVAEDVIATRTLQDLDGFDDLRKRLEVTPQAVVQAAWLSVLQTLVSPILTIGVITSGRAIDFQDADKVVGPLFNTIPFSVHIIPGMTSASLISTCHEFNMQMQDFQHTPLKDIQKWSPVASGQRLFDNLFVFQREDASDNSYAQGIWTQEESANTAQYPLSFEATLSTNGKLKLFIVAQGTVLTQSDAAELLTKMERSLLASIQSSGQNIVSNSDEVPHNLRQVSKDSHTSPTIQIRNEDAFQWSTEANIIRREIAYLANMSEDIVLEQSSIFELGLDSIDVIKLASRLKKEGIEILVSAIIRGQTIANMLPKISLQNTQPFPEITESVVQKLSRDLTDYLIKTGNIPEDLQVVWPATPLQQSMVSEMIRSNYERYFNLELFKLDTEVDVQRLKGALEHVFDSSPILRTSFVAIEDPGLSISFAQIVHNRRLHFSESSENRSIESFLEDIKRDSIKSAKQGLLFQVHYITTKQHRFMVIALSHALYDGSSIRLFHKRLREAYYGTYITDPDFQPFLEDVFRSTTQEARIFWKSTLSNTPLTRFPRKVLTEVQDTNAVHRVGKRSRLPLADLENLCKSLRITLQTLGQTCWTIILAHLTSHLDVVFGAVLSCRDSEEANEVMFPLMNSVAVRCVLHGTLGEMLKYMQEMGDTTRQYQHFSPGTAQAYALASRNDKSTANDTTLFDTIFIYQGRRTSVKEDTLYGSVLGDSEVEFPICVEMEIVDEHVIWTTACKSIVRTFEETDEIIAMLDSVLERMISEPQAPTIITDNQGISVCGLPKFSHPEMLLHRSKPPPTRHALGEEWTDTELSIRKALYELSNVPEEQIRKDSTIFHLGLDSILVLKLPPLLKRYEIKLSISDILKAQTITAMAKLSKTDTAKLNSLDVEGVLTASTADFQIAMAIGDLDMGEVKYCMPATAGQLYMIRMCQVLQGVLFYSTFKYIFKEQLDKTRLENAWRALLERHDILRTGFLEYGSDMFQLVYKRPQNEIEYNINSAATVHCSPFDLREPPVKLVVTEAGGQIGTVTLHIHHALYDGISLPILIDELQELYLGQALKVPDSSFRTFVAQSINASKRSVDPKYTIITQEKWMDYLGPWENSDAFPSITTVTNPNQRTELFYSSISVTSLKPLAQESGVTVDALLLATFSKIQAASLPHQPKHIAIGIYLANRTLAPTLVAPTLNLLPLRIQNPLSRPLREIAIDIQRDLQLIGTAEMSGASLADIYSWTGARVDTFVNILKNVVSDSPILNKKDIFLPVEYGDIAPVVHEIGGQDIVNIINDDRYAAYIPSVDVEIRYQSSETEGKIDIGIFAPTEKLDKRAAEKMIEDFLKECRSNVN